MTSSSYPPPSDFPDTEPDSEWARRFARSSRDRKLGGVAGGIGRALGIDPVLVRVAFVVLTIFGGAGVALYVLGWLLLPGENDEVSAAEALLGRGHSSVSPGLTILLGIVLIGSVMSTFTVGLPLLPIAIGALVVTAIVGHRRRRDHSCHNGHRAAHWERREDQMNRQVQDFSERAARWGEDLGRKAERWGDEVGRKAERWADDVGRRAERWGSGLGHRPGPRGRQRPDRRGPDRPASRREYPGAAAHQRPEAPGPRPDSRSPFDRPPFWEDQPADHVDLTKHAGSPASEQQAAPQPATPQPATGTDRRTGSASSASAPPPSTDEPSAPPAWDPLGAAPFAWDLPEPGPQPPSLADIARERRGKAIGRATIGVALLVAGVMALGQSADWWTLNWAVIAGASLAVVAFGVLVSALTGRPSRLIGLGVILSVATVGLAVLGIDGRDGFGDRTYAPATAAEVQASYRLDGGNLTVDLSGIDVDRRTTITTDVAVDAGQVTVILPKDVAAEVTCESLVGSLTCLDKSADGMRNSHQVSQPGAKDAGKIVLDVSARAGDVQVRRG